MEKDSVRTHRAIVETLYAASIMNCYFRYSSYFSHILLLLFAVLMGSICGCAEPELDMVTDAGTLLERYEKDRRRHDPLHFSEVDLGEFTVTKPQKPAIFFIRFHLYAVVPDGLVDQFNEVVLTHGQRIRDKVSEATQRCEIDQLKDPSLGWLKSELITSINRIVQSPLLRDVVFADFSLERG